MKRTTITYIVAIGLLLCSCQSTDKKALKAARLTVESTEALHQMDLKEAQKKYNQAQEIIRKYDNHKRQHKFDSLYRAYRNIEMDKIKE